MNKAVAPLLAFCLLGTGGEALRAETLPQQQHSFAIYVAEGLGRRIVMRGTDGWRDAELAETPIVTDADLVSYDVMQHAMTLKPEAMARLPKPPVEGIPFVVVADGQRSSRAEADCRIHQEGTANRPVAGD